ncbi:MAG: NADH-quinone oxidoreductase subunit H [Candidatus Bathyarchaeia archaeon]
MSSGGNKYSLFGAQREIAQVVSYEIILALALLNPILMVHQRPRQLIGGYSISKFSGLLG